MIGQKISHYKILDELGSGGMGVVYRAHDHKLDRTVALKFILPQIVKKKRDARQFNHEARAAASLNHPHICTVYEIDEQEGNTFIAMEYVEGPSLRELTRKGPLEVEEALDFSIQIAEGLQEAHEKGIIHRDIKSSNIIVTKKNQVKIMDFGLAKITGDQELSETRTLKGTVTYMSPEQAVGGDIDYRTDIWSLGVVMYEMLSGNLPFESAHDPLVLHSIINEEPFPLTEIRKNIPFELERIVEKCLSKDPGHRYQSTAELVDDLVRVKQEIAGKFVSSFSKKRVKENKRTLKRFIPLALVIIALLGAGSGFFVFNWFDTSFKSNQSIAVMPFESFAPEKMDEWLCSTLTLGLIGRLDEACPELRVVPLASVEKYQIPLDDINKIGRELKVRNILTSKVHQQDEKIIITAELFSIENRRQRHLEDYQYEFEKKDYQDVQDEILKSVVHDLGLYFMESGLMAFRQRESPKIEASLFYQQGMKILDQKDQYENLEKWLSDAIDKFDRALEVDQNFALAYWGKGAAYEAYYVATDQRENLVRMMEFFKKAYELNPNLAETNISMGWAYYYQEDLDQAYKYFKRALRISPDNPLVITDAAQFLVSIGLFKPALELFSRAIRLEPSYLRAYLLKSLCHWSIGEFENSFMTIKERHEIEKDDSNIRLYSARSLIMMDRFDQAQKELDEVRRILKLEPDEWESSFKRTRALLKAKKGQREPALELIKDIENQYGLPITCIYSLLGMKDEAVENIRYGIKNGFQKSQSYLYGFRILNNNPCYDNLRDDPRFVEILKQQKKKYKQHMKKYGDL